MKKAILAVLALASVVACNKSEVLEVAPQKAISFGNPFVENSTKAIDPSYGMSGNNELKNFSVYGTISNTNGIANIFSGVNVSKSKVANTDIFATGTWYYDASNVQYWVPGNTYAFSAVAGVNGVIVNVDDNKMPETITYDASTQTDLLYAFDNYGVFGNESAVTVDFSFNHLLSKAKFSFTNGCPEGFTVTVSDVKIMNAYPEGTYTVGKDETGKYVLANGVWNVKGTGEELKFGNIVLSTESANDATAVPIPATEGENVYSSNYERLLIPADYTTTKLTIQFSYIIKNKEGLPVKSESNKTVGVGVNFVAGNSYNFMAEIKEDLTPITFTVTSTGSWTSKDQTVTIE